MALSPNYSWAEPDNSSLVKNGAQDIRALGDAIDTSVWNVGFGQAGKNKIINGDFGINQRNFTSIATTNTYGYDRFFIVLADGTVTWTPQVFALGAAPVAGYESTNFSRIVTTGQTAVSAIARLDQRIENVRTFAGQTVTVSFWAKAATGTPSIAPEFQQVFGSGGSPSATVNGIIAGTPKQAITTSWARYSFTIAVPSISGKTIGTNNDSSLTLGLYVSAGSNFNARTGSLGIQSNTFDIWGVQVEYGSKATPFQTATGTIQGELAACQRYLPAWTGTSNQTLGVAANTNNTRVTVPFMVTPRVAPTGLTYSNLTHFAINNPSLSSGDPTSITFVFAGTSSAVIGVDVGLNAPVIATGTTVQFSADSSSALLLFTGCEL